MQRLPKQKERLEQRRLINDFFKVTCLDVTQSPDPPVLQESFISQLAEKLRDAPTVPGNPEHPETLWAAALFFEYAFGYRAGVQSMWESEASPSPSSLY